LAAQTLQKQTGRRSKILLKRWVHMDE